MPRSVSLDVCVFSLPKMSASLFTLQFHQGPLGVLHLLSSGGVYLFYFIFITCLLRPDLKCGPRTKSNSCLLFRLLLSEEGKKRHPV